MREALWGTPERMAKRPPVIVEHRINPDTGLIADDRARDTIFEKFDIDHVPDREEGGYVPSLDGLDAGPGSKPAGNPFFE